MLDTNVLFAALYSASGRSFQLLNVMASGQVRLALSTPLLFDYEDVLKRSPSMLSLSNAEVDVVLDNLCALADFHAEYFLWRPCLPDAKDDMVLELAVAAHAPHTVTFSAKDFGPAARFGIGVVSPRTFLEEFL